MEEKARWSQGWVREFKYSREIKITVQGAC